MGEIRFYIDADVLGLAKLLVQVRPDVTFPGDPGGLGCDGLLRPPCPTKPGDLDPDWIPKVAKAGWVIITRDRRMLHKPAEKQAILDSKARVVRFDARHELTKWLQLEIVITQWRRIEELSELPGPWIYRASRTAPLVKEL
jgi:PIN like domain